MDRSRESWGREIDKEIVVGFEEGRGWMVFEENSSGAGEIWRKNLLGYDGRSDVGEEG